MESLELETIDQLWQFKLSKEQRQDCHLNIITGYVVYDEHFIILFLEGCLSTGMKTIMKLMERYFWKYPFLLFAFSIR
jgi:hypothetical protein